MPGLPLRVRGDVAVDKGQHFPVALDAKHPWRAVEPGCLQMPQVLVHRGRPRTNRPQQPVTAAHDPAGHAPTPKAEHPPLDGAGDRPYTQYHEDRPHNQLGRSVVS